MSASMMCAWCKSLLEATPLRFDVYATRSMLRPKDILGHVCPACGVASCRRCVKQALQTDVFWSGYEKAGCQKCSESILNRKYSSPTRGFEPPRSTNARPSPTGARSSVWLKR